MAASPARPPAPLSRVTTTTIKRGEEQRTEGRENIATRCREGEKDGWWEDRDYEKQLLFKKSEGDAGLRKLLALVPQVVGQQRQEGHLQISQNCDAGQILNTNLGDADQEKLFALRGQTTQTSSENRDSGQLQGKCCKIL